MIFLELTRMETGPEGTIGVLTLNKQVFCFVMEPAKRENERNISCIPTGQYLCRRYDSTRYERPCLRVTNVQSREGIVFHPGNTARDTNGCLLPGTYAGEINGERAVMRSTAAHDALMSEIRDICHLTIREAF